MTEVDLVTLVFWIRACLAVVHLGRAGSLEHALNIERERALELTRACGCTQSLLCACRSVERVVGKLIDIEAIQTANSTIVAVDVVLLLELLVYLQQVVNVVTAQYQATANSRNAQLIHSFLHTDKVVWYELDTSSLRIA